MVYLRLPTILHIVRRINIYYMRIFPLWFILHYTIQHGNGIYNKGVGGWETLTGVGGWETLKPVKL